MRQVCTAKRKKLRLNQKQRKLPLLSVRSALDGISVLIFSVGRRLRAKSAPGVFKTPNGGHGPIRPRRRFINSSSRFARKQDVLPSRKSISYHRRICKDIVMIFFYFVIKTFCVLPRISKIPIAFLQGFVRSGRRRFFRLCVNAPKTSCAAASGAAAYVHIMKASGLDSFTFWCYNV